MAFNILDALGALSKTGVAKQHSFQVMIHPPAALVGLIAAQGVPPMDARFLAFRCESIDMPGRTLQTIDYVTDWGAMRRIPYRPMYVDVGATIVCSDDLREKIFFEAWQDMAIGSHRDAGTGVSGGQVTGSESVPQIEQFGIGYYEDYVSTIEMMQYDDSAKQSYHLICKEAYPIIVSPLQSNWSSEDIHRIQIQFSYRFFKDFTITKEYPAKLNTGPGFLGSMLPGIMGVGAGAIAGKLGPLGGLAGAGLTAGTGMAQKAISGF